MPKLFVAISLISLTAGSGYQNNCSGQTSDSDTRAASRMVDLAISHEKTCKLLDGEWLESSYEVDGTKQVATEYDTRQRKLVPVDVLWYFTRSQLDARQTRAVLYGNTEINAGNLVLGGYTIDTTKKPHRITFEHDGDVIGGVFQLEGDVLVLALPQREWDHEIRAYCVGKRPQTFETMQQDKQPWQVSISDKVTVYRLTRSRESQPNKAVNRSTQ